MKKTFAAILIIPVFAIFMLSHCGGDSADTSANSTTTLTDDQANAIAITMSSSLGLIVDSSLGFSKLSTRAQTTEDVSGSESCEGGGSVSISGTQAGVEGSTINGATNVELSFNDCGVSFSDTETILVNGTLSVDGNIDYVISSGPSISGSSSGDVTGTLDVSGDSVETGTCGVDLNVSSTASGTMIDLTFSGSFCGEDYDYSVTVDVGDDN